LRRSASCSDQQAEPQCRRTELCMNHDISPVMFKSSKVEDLNVREPSVFARHPNTIFSARLAAPISAQQAAVCDIVNAAFRQARV
jgi:hypothetical protein